MLYDPDYYEPLRQEIRELAEETNLGIAEGLTRCRNQYEEDQCKDAWWRLYRGKMDAASQRYGMAPMLWFRRP